MGTPHWNVNDLPAFIMSVRFLLETMDKCKEVLFRRSFRQQLSIGLALERLSSLQDRLKEVKDDTLRNAGLSDNQLQMKLESYSYSVQKWEEEAAPEELVDALDKAEAILQSLTGMIPGFGSLLQELVAFIQKELRRRFLPKWLR